MRVKLTVAYDGTDYCGWQIQPNGNTVQQELMNAVADLFGEEISVPGASRTDAGVHAHGNVCCIDVDTKMDPGKIAFALNRRLPEDIVVTESVLVPDGDNGFHPRYGAYRKAYEYRIWNMPHPDPILRRYTLHHHHHLDEALMDHGGQYLVGEHDFTSFASVKSQTDSFVRTIYALSVTRSESGLVTIHVEGNGFLYNMVRIIAGTLIMVGDGRMKPEEIKDILGALDREKAGPTAPPQGLHLLWIDYD